MQVQTQTHEKQYEVDIGPEVSFVGITLKGVPPEPIFVESLHAARAPAVVKELVKPGDELTAVNDVPVWDLDQEEMVTALRMRPLHLGLLRRLQITGEAPAEEVIAGGQAARATESVATSTVASMALRASQEIQVQCTGQGLREPICFEVRAEVGDDRLGIICCDRPGPVSVESVVPGGVAAGQGVQSGDVILTINGRYVQVLERPVFESMLRERPLLLSLLRQAGSKRHDDSSKRDSSSGYPPVSKECSASESAPHPRGSDTVTGQSRRAVAAVDADAAACRQSVSSGPGANFCELVFHAGDTVLGIVPGACPPGPVHIETVLEGSLAAARGVSAQDEILAVDGEEVESMAREYFIDALRRRPVRLLMRKPAVRGTSECLPAPGSASSLPKRPSQIASGAAAKPTPSGKMSRHQSQRFELARAAETRAGTKAKSPARGPARPPVRSPAKVPPADAQHVAQLCSADVLESLEIQTSEVREAPADVHGAQKALGTTQATAQKNAADQGCQEETGDELLEAVSTSPALDATAPAAPRAAESATVASTHEQPQRQITNGARCSRKSRASELIALLPSGPDVLPQFGISQYRPDPAWHEAARPHLHTKLAADSGVRSGAERRKSHVEEAISRLPREAVEAAVALEAAMAWAEEADADIATHRAMREEDRTQIEL